MQFPDWIAREGRGAISRIRNATQLNYVTVFRAAHGRAVTYPTARLISKATGGAVSIQELCHPDGATATVRKTRHRSKTKAERAA